LKTIFSLGYGSRNINAFVDLLQENKINVLVDTRELPISRKSGFSKKSLTTRLEDEGIDYVHFKQLGSPSWARSELKRTGDYDTFFLNVRNHLECAAEDALSAVSELVARKKRLCLMCLCPDVSKCHRSIVLDLLDERFSIKHAGLRDNQPRAA
jgi:uncharacterized protein (DUF488 family)